MKDKYLINIDLDGTLLNGTRPIYNENQEHWKLFRKVYKELTRQGHVVCINTGRTWETSKQVYLGVGMNSPISNTNGTSIFNPTDNSFKHFKSIASKDLINKIIDKYSADFFMASYTNDGILYIIVNENATITEYHEKIFKNFGTEPLRTSRVHDDFASIRMRFKTESNAAEKICEEIDKSLSCTLYPKEAEPGYDVVEISKNDASKGKALDYISDQLGINRKYTMAIGDDSNDMELFKHAEVKVAMNNAIDELKEQSTIVTDYKNNDSGVSKFLIDYFDLKI